MKLMASGVTKSAASTRSPSFSRSSSSTRMTMRPARISATISCVVEIDMIPVSRVVRYFNGFGALREAGGKLARQLLPYSPHSGKSRGNAAGWRTGARVVPTTVLCNCGDDRASLAVGVCRQKSMGKFCQGQEQGESNEQDARVRYGRSGVGSHSITDGIAGRVEFRGKPVELGGCHARIGAGRGKPAGDGGVAADPGQAAQRLDFGAGDPGMGAHA